VQPLQLIGGTEDFGSGFSRPGINDSGQVTGFANQHAFLTGPDGEGLKFLGTLKNTPLGQSFAFAVNNQGQVAGTSVDYTGPPGHQTITIRAFLSGPNGGPLKDVGTLGGEESSASAVNDAGQVAGLSEFALGNHARHAFLSGPNGGPLTDLGTLGGDSSAANGVNNAGDVVGTSGTSDSSSHAFVYTSADGLRDLNDLIDPQLGIILTDAFDINNSGQIVALARPDESVAAYLLTPTGISAVPDGGSTAALLGCAFVGLFFVRLLQKRLRSFC
jgi:probable HAF family extracellular repeat protein